jgi:hypothetical protein
LGSFVIFCSFWDSPETIKYKDYLKQRSDLIQHIFASPKLDYTRWPDLIENDHQDARWKEIGSLKSIARIVINFENGLHSIAYHFRPISSNQRLFIYHQGHNGGFILGAKTIATLLENGYSVLAFTMPLIGMNQPEDCNMKLPSGKTICLKSHQDFVELENEGINPMHFFVEPVIAGINYLEKYHHYDSIDMLGISGGGFTTFFVAALDDRIRNSYPVAGGLPFSMRNDPRDLGDFEQLKERPLYRIASYLDLFLLGALEQHRKQVQILIADDSCCFAVRGREEQVGAYAKKISEDLASADGGKFEVLIDYSTKNHEISDWAIRKILSENE